MIYNIKELGIKLKADADTLTDQAFFLRGGYYGDKTEAGAFAFGDNNGNANHNYSYRLVLVCE